MKCIRSVNFEFKQQENTDFFNAQEMQCGPYDAYMEVPYKNVDKDTKLDLPYSYDSK